MNRKDLMKTYRSERRASARRTVSADIYAN